MVDKLRVNHFGGIADLAMVEIWGRTRKFVRINLVGAITTALVLGIFVYSAPNASAANVAGTVTSLNATPGNTQVGLTWTAPASNGGSAITDYLVDYKRLTAAPTVTTYAGTGSQGSANGSAGTASFYSPSSIAIDPDGIAYVADANNNKIRKILPDGTVSTFAGTGASTPFANNNNGLLATFNSPQGVALDNSGNLYVADAGNNRIRKITPAGAVTTFSGDGVAGTTNGVAATARFNAPHGLTVDSSGNVYVADTTNNRIRLINSSGTASTYAGSSQGFADGTAAARFWNPWGVAVDADGYVYVSDTGNHAIRKITPGATQTVSTLAGSGSYGSANGTGSAAQFYSPLQLTLDSDNNIYVADFFNNRIRKVTPAGETSDYVTSGLNFASGIAIDSAGDFLVANNLGNDIKKLTEWTNFADGVSTSTGATVTGLTNGTTYNFRVRTVNAIGRSASATATAKPRTVPDAPTSLTARADESKAILNWTAPAWVGGTVLTDYQIEYKLSSDSSWSVFADGTSTTASAVVTGLTNASGYDFRVSAINGAGTGAASSTASTTPSTVPAQPTGLGATAGNTQVGLSWTAPSATGKAPVTDYSIEYQTSGQEATVSTFLSSSSGGFSSPNEIARDSKGNLFVADRDNNVIKKVTPGGASYIFAGSGVAGKTNGTGTAATFNKPTGIAIDSSDNLFVTDYGSQLIRKITPSGVVTTFAGGVPYIALADGNGTNAAVFYPTGITIDSSNNLYVTELGNDTIRKITPTADVTTIAGGVDNWIVGQGGNPGFTDGFGTAARFNDPNGIAVSNDGQTLYVADMGNHSIRYIQLSNSNYVGTLAGNGSTGFADATGTSARFASPSDIALDSNSGNLFVTDTGNQRIRKVTTAGVVTTYAGSSSSGAANGAASSATFSSPTDIFIDPVGTMFVSEQGNNDLRMLTEWTTFADGTSTSTSATVTGLTNGTTYRFRVRATNITGTGLPNSYVTSTPLTTSTAPQSLSATPGNANIALTWSAPSSNGGDAITDYVVEYKLSSDPTWTTWADGTSTTPSATITGLTNGSSYDVRVAAVNNAGTGTASSSSSIIPYTVPDPATGLSATAGNTQVGLTWTAPAFNGGRSITDYVVQYKLHSDSSWSTFADGTSASTGATVTGLTNGSSYDFRVLTTNIAGNSSATSTVTATPYTVPGAPTSLNATAGSQQVGLTWSAPASNGGSSITDYVVEYKLSSDSSWSTFTDGTSTSASATVTGLIAGSSYDFRVSTVNAAGQGTASSTATATPYTTPDAPTLLEANKGNQQVSLDWVAPSDGSSAITDYVVQYRQTSGGGWATFADGTSASTSATVTGLTNGTSYDFQVIAVNAAGSGPASSSATATPSTTPSAPQSFVATAGTGQVSLTWSAPATNGGLSITDYVVDYKLSSDSSWTTWSDGVSSTPGTTITGLVNQSNYDFRVKAVNANGSGTAATTSATPFTTPGAPTSLSAAAGNTLVGLSWTAPASDGGSAVTDYIIEYKLSTDSSWTTFSDGTSNSTSANVTGLTNNLSYDFRVYATNLAGNGPASGTTSASPDPGYTVPDAPTSLVGTSHDRHVVLTWAAPLDTGGTPILDYKVEYKQTSSGSWSTFNDGVSTSASADVTSLVNGVNYSFRVSAINSVGTGSASSVATAIPMTNPAEPASITATAGDTQVQLDWTIPLSDGGDAVTDYVIDYKVSTDSTWTTFADGTSTSLTTTITGLTNGVTYDFTVSAKNSVGTGTSSDIASATPRTIPSAPLALGATSDDSQVALDWTAPASDGGSSVSNYLIEYKPTSSGSWSTFIHSVSASTAATVTGLTNGTSYDFRVSAINDAGTGPASATATATPANTPDAPSSLTPSAGDSQVDLSWTTPGSNGGTAITDYVVEYKASSDISWTTFTDGVSTSATATVTGLTNGTSYDFRVSAKNSMGTGPTSSTASATPRTVPDTPTNLIAHGIDSQVDLEWDAPSFDGGDTLTDYVVEYKLSSDSSWTVFADSTSTSPEASVTGLTNGTSYDFRVSGVNIAGTGAASSTTSATPHTVPTKPLSLVTTASSTQVDLSWNVPASNGGDPITDYQIEYRPSSGGSWTTLVDSVSTSTTATVTGLINGTSYDFRVSAINANGVGAASDAAVAIPFTTPDAPTTLIATPEDGQIDLGWNAPAFNGGRSVSDYVVEYKLSSSGSWTTFVDGVSSTNSATVTGLTNGSLYHFRVSAVNTAGTGPTSNVTPATPYRSPSAPSSVVATYGNTLTSLTWTAPSDDGGNAISDYTVQYKRSSSGVWLTAPHPTSTDTQLTVYSLTNGTSYDFRVFAVNSAGAGAASSIVSATPSTVPSTPTFVTATPGDSHVALSWQAPVTDGGMSIDDYAIEYKTSTDSTWSTFADGTSTALSADITSLANGIQYDFRVYAVNGNGSSSASSEVSDIPFAAPDAPSGLVATPTDSEIALTWTLPPDNGRAVSDYVVEYKLSTDSAWSVAADGVSTIASYAVSGLTNGENYDFRVAAVNLAGAGAWSSIVSSAPGSVPSEPLSPSASGDIRSAELNWSAPTTQGGDTISDYQISYKLSTSSTWTVFADGVSVNTNATITGLDNGSTYDFVIRAVNSFGAGPASSQTSATTFDTPGVSTSLAAIPSNSAASLAWVSPASDGGSPITDYTIEYQVSGAPSWTTFADGIDTTASATVTGLTNGTRYYFRVTAVNDVGAGAPSLTTTAIPRTIPTAPRALAATGATTSSSVHWSAPTSNGGSAITDYEIQYRLSSDSAWTVFAHVASTSTTRTLTSLHSGSSYYVRVAAVNAAGLGPFVSTTFTTKATAPPAPTSLVAAPSNSDTRLTWTPPAYTGGSAVKDYKIEYKLSKNSKWIAVKHRATTATNYRVKPLSNGASYNFRVAAVNSKGTGTASRVVNATPRTKPGTPLAVWAQPRASGMLITWKAPLSNGGATVMDYVIDYKPSTDTDWITFSDGVSKVTSATLTRLTNGVKYDFRISAVNAAGRSSASKTSSATPRTIPDSPTGLIATPGTGTVALQWAIPNNGGAAITDYIVQYRIGVGNWVTYIDGTNANNFATVTRLTRNANYQFRVQAKNIAGLSLFSSPVSALTLN